MCAGQQTESVGMKECCLLPQPQLQQCTIGKWRSSNEPNEIMIGTLKMQMGGGPVAAHLMCAAVKGSELVGCMAAAPMTTCESIGGTNGSAQGQTCAVRTDQSSG